jgi:hypothetical protein
VLSSHRDDSTDREDLAAVLAIVTTLPGQAFAWGTEGQHFGDFLMTIAI